VLEFMANNNYQIPVKRLGIPDEFINHGTQNELHFYCKYDTSAIIDSVHSLLEQKTVSQVG